MKQLLLISLFFLSIGIPHCAVKAGCKCKQRTPKQRARIKAKREERRARRAEKKAKGKPTASRRAPRKPPRKKK